MEPDISTVVIESPLEAFRLIHQDHHVLSYKDLDRPLVPRSIDIKHGVAIFPYNYNTDTKVSVVELDLSNAYDLEEKIDYRKLVVDLINDQLVHDQAGDMIYSREEQHPLNYLYTRELKKRPEYEALLGQILEVAGVALKIKEPAVNDLKRLLGDKREQL